MKSDFICVSPNQCVSASGVRMLPVSCSCAPADEMSCVSCDVNTALRVDSPVM